MITSILNDAIMSKNHMTTNGMHFLLSHSSVPSFPAWFCCIVSSPCPLSDSIRLFYGPYIAQKFLVVADVIVRIIEGICRDAEDGIILLPQHVAPHIAFHDQAFVGAVQQDFRFLEAVIQLDQDLAIGTPQDLAQLFVGVAAALDARRDIVDVVDALDGKGHIVLRPQRPRGCPYPRR